MNAATEQTFNFTIQASNESAHDWTTMASPEDLVGTLNEARDLARSLESQITLSDDAGFRHGVVDPSGDYVLA